MRPPPKPQQVVPIAQAPTNSGTKTAPFLALSRCGSVDSQRLTQKREPPAVPKLTNHHMERGCVEDQPQQSGIAKRAKSRKNARMEDGGWQTSASSGEGGRGKTDSRALDMLTRCGWCFAHSRAPGAGKNQN